MDIYGDLCKSVDEPVSSSILRLFGRLIRIRLHADETEEEEDILSLPAPALQAMFLVCGGGDVQQVACEHHHVPAVQVLIELSFEPGDFSGPGTTRIMAGCYLVSSLGTFGNLCRQHAR